LKTFHYLFLQGQISPFFAALGHNLHRLGHAVHRIHFNGGDQRGWTLPGAVDFNQRAEAWPTFLHERLKQWAISDLILFGDCRPLHRVAIAMARAAGVRVHVFEEGYLRPDYITMEAGGVNGHSSLPRSAAAYLRAAAALSPLTAPSPISARFSRRAADDFLYHLGSAIAAPRFPHYQSHRPWHPLREYAVGVHRFPLKAITRKATQRRIEALVHGGRPYFLFPMQLDADSQIRFHAPPGGMIAAIESVMRSFAQHADRNAQLVITEHPLDYGPVDLKLDVVRVASELNLADRVLFLRGGSPPLLMANARGIITVNSTLGITALGGRIPVIALGKAIYNLAGLTFQRGIDAFWSDPQPPRADVFDAFRRVVIARTQINGGFFSEDGIAIAVAGTTQRLLALEASANATPAADHVSQLLRDAHREHRPDFALPKAHALTTV
jgi:capsular polysaccharide export protein